MLGRHLCNGTVYSLQIKKDCPDLQTNYHQYQYEVYALHSANSSADQEE